MKFELSEAIRILSRTPMTLRSLLYDLPDPWVHANEGAGTWSAYDVVGHLIHGEKTDWIPRLDIILSSNANKQFEPYDRFAQFENSKGKSLGELLNEFENLRKLNLQSLQSRNLSEADLSKQGIHPEFGPVTASQLLATWVAHDMTHIVQTARVIGKQYEDAVGPWKAYLGIFRK